KNDLLWWELGICHARAREWDHAVSCLRKAYELDPENRFPGYGNSLGYCLARVGKYEESLAIFRKTTNEADAQFQLAQMLHHVKQDDMSRHHLRLALKANPNLVEARKMLAELENAPRPTQTTRSM